MSIPVGTKAQTLERVSALLTTATVLPLIHFAARDWLENPQPILGRIRKCGWSDIPLIVRSSAFCEDASTQSMAGHFLSVPDVQGESRVKSAVEEVIRSFGGVSEQDEVLVQPMLRNVAISGVAFTRDPSTGGHYYVINYDDSGTSTNSVTLGCSDNLKMFYCFKNPGPQISDPMGKIIALCRELENLLGLDALDIEFAMDRGGTLFLFQVRPLVGIPPTPITPELHEGALRDAERRFVSLDQPHPYLHGSRTVFGIMPDWNPAEIIGVRPKPLALSLYREVITDNIWAYQRNNYGYRNLRSFPLLISFCGLPYIDVRVDFNSFIPADVEPDLAEKLVNHYIDQLVRIPSHHDKVEFEILFTCYTLDLPQRINKLLNFGFAAQEIETLLDSLRRLTNHIINSETGLWTKDIERIKVLDDRFEKIRNCGLDIPSKIYWLLEDCKRYGTLPFAGLARAGFIAVQLLKSLVNVGCISPMEFSAFLESLNTVNSRMASDFRALSRHGFLERYGHLRPGTYDILSPRYDEEPERYFDWNALDRRPEHTPKPFLLSLDQLKRTETLLKEHRLEHNLLGFFDFIKGAIEGREYGKFVFTRSLSLILALCRQLGAENGFTVEDCSFLDMLCVKEMYVASVPVKEFLQRTISQNRRNYDLTRQITLPPLVTRKEDLWAFDLPQAEPNFIGHEPKTGRVAFIHDKPELFRDAILFIQNADPGYDWIFSHGIGGLVTMYGGMNSHMAIRAAELGIPAVIGCGCTYYTSWSKAGLLEIDCLNKRVNILR